MNKVDALNSSVTHTENKVNKLLDLVAQQQDMQRLILSSQQKMQAQMALLLQFPAQPMLAPQQRHRAALVTAAAAAGFTVTRTAHSHFPKGPSASNGKRSVPEIVCHLKQIARDRACSGLKHLFAFSKDCSGHSIGWAGNCSSRAICACIFCCEERIRRCMSCCCATRSRSLLTLFSVHRCQRQTSQKDMGHRIHRTLQASRHVQDRCRKWGQQQQQQRQKERLPASEGKVLTENPKGPH
jgi:hypothetical protein